MGLLESFRVQNRWFRSQAIVCGFLNTIEEVPDSVDVDILAPFLVLKGPGVQVEGHLRRR
ncbi:hypothetical protein EV356DRAFT_496350 [Viridothelium virens]|uniref:Uncharacterized protein n=1 Tax=Viridothelium virens TaxID=1048519 RepID=A0A6A6GTZ0_VIRVR|nr:hypothetical protein EV356DRAFT_496350 [Viridothelium virens]